MQTTLSIRALVLLMLAALSSACTHASYAATIKLHDGNDKQIVISTENNILHVDEATKSNAITIHPTSNAKTSLLSAETLEPVNKQIFHERGNKIVILAARYQSVSGNPMGYCGSGHEDYLLLFKIDNETLTLLDRLLIQSCLKSIALISDNPNDLVSAIKWDQSTHSIHTQQIMPPDFHIRSKTITIRKLHFHTN